MLEVQPMPGHEVVKEALLIHGAPGGFKQLQRDGGFFFEVFYKMNARVHASTTERSILGLAIGYHRNDGNSSGYTTLFVRKSQKIRAR